MALFRHTAVQALLTFFCAISFIGTDPHVLRGCYCFNHVDIAIKPRANRPNLQAGDRELIPANAHSMACEFDFCRRLRLPSLIA
jgi:hypothetical protein